MDIDSLIKLIDGWSAVVVIIAIIWWRLNRVEQKLDRLEMSVSKLWYRIAKVDSEKKD